MTEIVAILEIVILPICAVYVAFRVVKAIIQKKSQEPEKDTLCDTCEHLERKGGDIESGKYKCGFLNGSFNKSPEYCRNHKPRNENKELPEAKP